jgi:hypothetical protein
MEKRMEEKLQLTQLLAHDLKAYEWERIKQIIDRQFREKANKLTLDDLSCEALKKWFEMEFTR